MLGDIDDAPMFRWHWLNAISDVHSTFEMSNAAKRRVLVLDDDFDFCDLLQLLLESALDIECVVAQKLSELVARAPEVMSCELAILDVNLGQGEPSGIDAFDWLRKHGFRGAIVFLTGHARCHPLIGELTEREQVRVLEKPIETGTLLALFAPSSIAAGTA